MKPFLRDRGPSLAVVVLILFAISLALGAISYTMTLGALRGFLSSDVSLLTTGLIVLRVGYSAGHVVALQTQTCAFPVNHSCQRLGHVGIAEPHERPIAALFGAASPAVRTLLLDVGLMAVSNILIFSIWYWIIDPPGVEEIARADEP
jgi:hypothetical protein